MIRPTKYSNPIMIIKIPDIFSACERHARQTRKNIKQAANEYFFPFAWLDAHKQKENIWYLLIIIGIESYDDYQVFKSYHDHQVQGGHTMVFVKTRTFGFRKFGILWCS